MSRLTEDYTKLKIGFTSYTTARVILGQARRVLRESNPQRDDSLRYQATI